MSISENPTILRGSILLYRVFDIAEEINLPAVEVILREMRAQTRLALTRTVRHAVVIRNAPVRFRLGEVDLPFETTMRAEVMGTIWDYGVISILFQIPIPSGTPWTQLVEWADLLNRQDAGNRLDALAREKSREVSQLIKPALKNPVERNQIEDYAIYMLEELDGVDRSVELIRALDYPALILGEPKEKLSRKQREDILESYQQYGVNDLAVIDWNSAVLVEPSGSRDIPDILEFALSHLLEFRYYDDLLDERIESLYDAIEFRRAGIFGNRFTILSHEANKRFLEFSEFIERIDNSLKVVGDFYLSVIFRSAVKRFRIPDWQQSVTRKMNLLARMAELLHDEVNVFRSHALEIIIILLILFEVVQALVKGV